MLKDHAYKEREYRNHLTKSFKVCLRRDIRSGKTAVQGCFGFFLCYI